MTFIVYSNDKKLHSEGVWNTSDSNEISLYCRKHTQPFPHLAPYKVTNVPLPEFSIICSEIDFHAS